MQNKEEAQNNVSNVTILSNIALTPEQKLANDYNKEYEIQKYKEKKEWKKLIPGDLYADLFPEDLDSRIIKQNMTPKQIKEYQTYLPCLKCGKHCAGTCE